MPFITPPSAGFLNRFPSWIRIEPRAREDDFSRGLQARTADPLWMLGRQWQMGEFAGEDTGSAITVNVAYRPTPLTKTSWPITQPTNARGLKGGAPIDMMVEARRFPWDWRRRVQIGQRYESFIRDLVGESASPIIAKLRAALPVGPNGDAGEVLDPSTQRYLALVAGRVVDGKRVSDDVNWSVAPIVAPRSWGLTAADEAAVRALTPLKQWLSDVYPTWAEDSAWNAERLRHEFALDGKRADGHGVRLVARDHEGGSLSWFDATISRTVVPVPDVVRPPTVPFQPFVPVPIVPVPPPVTPPPRTVRAVPTRVAFTGAPHPRWWAFEDSAMQLGSMEVNTTDVAKLGLIEFAVAYGNDFLSIPLPVQSGLVLDIVSVTVTDVFGRNFDLHPAENVAGSGTQRFQLYVLSEEGKPTSPGASGALYIPPISSDGLEMTAEELLFLRDEGANLVFAVEHRVANARGDSVPGIERGFVGDEQDNSTIDGVRYRLATLVPWNWFPFVPVARDAERREVRLRKALMLRNVDDESPTPIDPLGSLLRDNGDWLEEASVPRSGVKLQLVRRRARGADGKTYVWMARQVRVGKGEGKSGLKFDVLREGGQ